MRKTPHSKSFLFTLIGAFGVAALSAQTPAPPPVAAPAAAAPAPSPSLEWKSADGKNKFKIGVFGQLQLESIDDTVNGGDAQVNLFARRLRLIASYSFGDKLSVLLDTDSPNLGKGDGAGGKNESDVFLQDFIATYSHSNAFKVDAGMILAPLSYNHNQSAFTLMALDYGAATFDESAALKQRVGRDYGVMFRGYVLDDHLEYRLGLFGGVRGRRAAAGQPFQENDLRTTARLVYWAYGAQKGYFYRGTSFGKSKSLGIGVTFDQQEDYSHSGVDLYWDQPLAGGNGLTFQLDYASLDGDTFVALPERTNVMAEIGFYIASLKLLPYVHYAQRDLEVGADTTWTEIGLGRFMSGHNNNLKIAFTRIETEGARDRDQLRLQWQVFAF